VIDPLTPPDASEDVVFLRFTVGWDEDSDRLSDQLRSCVAEQSLRRGVARLDDAVQVLRENGVTGRFDDRGEIGLRERWIPDPVGTVLLALPPSVRGPRLANLTLQRPCECVVSAFQLPWGAHEGITGKSAESGAVPPAVSEGTSPQSHPAACGP
jgi:hypothetical protein